MESKKSNKINDIVRLQKIIKKWKNLAAGSRKNQSTVNCKNFLKRTLSFTGDQVPVPKGFLAVCVGSELRRFVIPMAYLTHEAFTVLLKEAEDEFGFQQDGVLKIPCEEATFERILREVIEGKTSSPEYSALIFPRDELKGRCSSELTPATLDHRRQLCK